MKKYFLVIFIVALLVSIVYKILIPGDFENLKLVTIKDYEFTVDGNCPKAALVYQEDAGRKILELLCADGFSGPHLSHYVVEPDGLSVLSNQKQMMTSEQIAKPHERSGYKFEWLQTGGAGGMSPYILSYWLKDEAGVKISKFEGTNSDVVYAGDIDGIHYFVIGKYISNTEHSLQLGVSK